MSYRYENLGLEDTFTGQVIRGAVYDRNGIRVCELWNTMTGDKNGYIVDNFAAFNTFIDVAMSAHPDSMNPVDDFVADLSAESDALTETEKEETK
jgi:hypothetical protein